MKYKNCLLTHFQFTDIVEQFESARTDRAVEKKKKKLKQQGRTAQELDVDGVAKWELAIAGGAIA